jgi:hypothetical protein
MPKTIAREALELLARGQETGDGVITEARLAGLPEPVRRYLHYARVVGKAPIRTVRLKQRGAMVIGQGSKWLPMRAEQYFTANPPGFLWHGTLHPFPFVPVSATDTYRGGHGILRIKALSLIPLGTARGLEMDQGELLRYLGEMAWFPTAFLADCIRWEAIDTESAKVTISLPPITASGIMHVNAQGRYTRFTAVRYREEHKRLVPRPWTGRWADYREVNGFRIPMKAEAAYTLETGEFSYFRGKVMEIGYDHSEPY